MLFQQRKRLLSIVAFVLIPLALAAQGPRTTPPGTNGKMRIVSTADDALCVGGSVVAPTTTDCGGGIYAAKINITGTIKATSSSAFAPTQTFRNLLLRTHPDNDVAASKVELMHADEVVADDGARFSDVNLLVADIAASGAGGLDTGTEAGNGASVWYETYFIAKEDGTKNLLLHRSKDYFKDTSFTTSVDASRALRRATTTSTDKLAQSFQLPTAAGKVEFVDVPISIATAPTGRIWMTLEADSAGSPSGTPLATSDKFNGNVFPTAAFNQRFIFRTPATLTTSTTYWLVLQGDYTRSDTVNDIWRGVAAGGYASGSAKEYNGTVWSAATGVGDFDFQMYVTRNDTTVTMPSGYTKKALVGFVYNNSGSNFDPFVALNKKVRKMTGTGAAFAAIAFTTPTLTDLSSLLPPRPVIGEVMVNNTVAGNSDYLAGVPDGYGTLGLNVDFGFIAMTSPGVSYVHHLGSVYTDYQGAYVYVSSGTGTFILHSWEWF